MRGKVEGSPSLYLTSVISVVIKKLAVHEHEDYSKHTCVERCDHERRNFGICHAFAEGLLKEV